jgi:hypothetical protein
MFQDNIFDKWLDTKTQEIIKNMGDGKPLSSEEMMVLVLKAQTNHFNHLDIELRDDMKTLREDLTNDMKTLREDMDKRFESLVTRMDRLMIWTFATTVSVGGIVIAAIKFLP